MKKLKELIIKLHNEFELLMLTGKIDKMILAIITRLEAIGRKIPDSPTYLAFVIRQHNKILLVSFIVGLFYAFEQMSNLP